MEVTKVTHSGRTLSKKGLPTPRTKTEVRTTKSKDFLKHCQDPRFKPYLHSRLVYESRDKIVPRPQPQEVNIEEVDLEKLTQHYVATVYSTFDFKVDSNATVVNNSTSTQSTDQTNNAVTVDSNKEQQSATCGPQQDINESLLFDQILNKLNKHFVAQSPDGQSSSPQSFFQRFMASQFVDTIKDFFSTVQDNIENFYDYITDKVCAIFNKFTALFPGPAGLLQNIGRNVFFSFFSGFFAPFKEFFKQMDKVQITFVIAAALTIVLYIFGFVTAEWSLVLLGCFSIACAGHNKIKDEAEKRNTYHKIHDDDWFAVAQSPVTVMSELLNIGSALFNLTKDSTYYIRTTCLTIHSIAQAINGTSVIMPVLCMVLPSCLTMIIREKFNIASRADQERFENWRSFSCALLTLKSCPEVLYCKEYSLYLQKCMDEGNALIKKQKIYDPTQKILLSTTLGHLMNTFASVATLDFATTTRNAPFSLHICGEPGHGKTELFKYLVRDVFQMDPKNAYTVMSSDPHWNGFHGQKIIHYDEFLTGTQQTTADVASHYLVLVSSADMYTPQASLDSLLIGIKGTKARPDIVITTSNSAYNFMEGFDPLALNRRRNMVVKVVNPRVLANSNDPEKAYHHIFKPEDVGFQILPIIEPKVKTEYPCITYDELKALVRNKHNVHKENIAKMAELFPVEEQVTPEQLVLKTLQSSFGIPDIPDTFKIKTHVTQGKSSDDSRSSDEKKDNRKPFKPNAVQAEKRKKKQNAKREAKELQEKANAKIAPVDPVALQKQLDEAKSKSQEDLSRPITVQEQEDIFGEGGELREGDKDLIVDWFGDDEDEDNQEIEAEKTSKAKEKDLTPEPPVPSQESSEDEFDMAKDRVDIIRGTQAWRDFQESLVDIKPELRYTYFSRYCYDNYLTTMEIRKLCSYYNYIDAAKVISGVLEHRKQAHHTLYDVHGEIKNIYVRTIGRPNGYDAIMKERKFVDSYSQRLDWKRSHDLLAVEVDPKRIWDGHLIKTSQTNRSLEGFEAEFTINFWKQNREILEDPTQYNSYCYTHSYTDYIDLVAFANYFHPVGHKFKLAEFTELVKSFIQLYVCERFIEVSMVPFLLRTQWATTNRDRWYMIWEVSNRGDFLLYDLNKETEDLITEFISDQFEDLGKLQRIGNLVNANTKPGDTPKTLPLGAEQNFKERVDSILNFNSDQFFEDYHISTFSNGVGQMIGNIFGAAAAGMAYMAIMMMISEVILKAFGVAQGNTYRKVRERERKDDNFREKSKVSRFESKHQIYKQDHATVNIGTSGAWGNPVVSQGLQKLDYWTLSVQGATHTCLPIGKRFFLIHAHALYDDEGPLTEGTTLHLVHKTRTYSFKLDYQNFVEINDRDLVVFELQDKSMNEQPSMLGKFMSFEQHKSLPTVFKGFFVGPDQYNTVSLATDQAEYHHGDRKLYLPIAYVAHMNTMPGYCGHVYISIDSNLSNYYVSLHVAGPKRAFFGSRAISSPIIKEEIVDAMKELGYEAQGYKLGPVDTNLRVYQNDKTKLKKSKFFECVPSLPNLCEPAVLSKHDPRTKNNPETVYLEKLKHRQLPTCKQEVLERAAKETIEKWMLIPKVLDRELTFTEAVRGVEGHLSALNFNTSMGLPWSYVSTAKGKKMYCHFDDDGSLIIDSDFELMVLERYEEVKSYNYDYPIDHIMVGYWKDELRPIEKIKSASTRLIFCNNIVDLVVFRMIFGSVMINFLKGFGYHSATVSLNQYSHDMEKILNHLEVKFYQNLVDGDLGGMDINIVTYFRERFYDWKTMYSDSWLKHGKKTFREVPCSNFMYKHDTQCPVMINDDIHPNTGAKFSGDTLTAMENNFVMECYYRGAFYNRFWDLVFDDWIRLITGGDDNASNQKDGLGWTPVQIAEDFAALGQTYTSSDKLTPLDENFKTVDQITYLGAEITQIDGYYCGRLKKSSIANMLYWTSNSDRLFEQVVTGAIEMASLWEEEFFDEVKESIVKIVKEEHPLMEFKFYGLTYTNTRRRVAARTSASGFDFFIAQSGKGKLANFKNVELVDTVRGLTSIVTGTLTNKVENPFAYNCDGIVEETFSEPEQPQPYGFNSLIKRDVVNWTTAQTQNTEIKYYDLPWDLIPDKCTDIQTMGFRNFLYSTVGMTIVLQVNGPPTFVGLLCVYFTPMNTGESPMSNVCFFPSAFITPQRNSTTELEIPFINNMSAFNNIIDRDVFSGNFLGRLHFKVFSQLRTKQSGTFSVPITVFVKFKGNFRIPRPIADLVAQGMAASKQSSTMANNYYIGTMFGDIPSEVSGHSASTNETDAKVDANIPIPFDNLPLSSSGAPVTQVLPGMSRNQGLRPTTLLAHQPCLMNRVAASYPTANQGNISKIMEIPGYLDSFNWSNADTEGTAKFDIPLRSTLCQIKQPFFSDYQIVPFNIALLNLFQYVKFDVVFTVRCVRNNFQSGRLSAIIRYGTDYSGNSDAENNYSIVLEYVGENDVCTFRVPYNMPVPYMKTFDGDGAGDKLGVYQMGTMSLVVTSQLVVSSDIVPSSVEVMVFASLQNVQCYEVRSNPMVDIVGHGLRIVTDTSPYPPLSDDISENSYDYVAQADSAPKEIDYKEQTAPENDQENPDEGTLIQATETTGEKKENEPVAVSGTKIIRNNVIPYKVNFSTHFDYNIKDIHEIVRRYMVYPENEVSYTNVRNTDGSTRRVVCTIPVVPHSIFQYVFVGWHGTLNFRIQDSKRKIESVGLMNHSGDTPPNSQNVLDSGCWLDLKTDHGYSFYFQNQASETPPFPIETINNSTGVIDVSCPFNSPYAFNLNLPFSFQDYMPNSLPSTHVLMLFGRPGETMTADDISIYWSFGDDARFHGLCPNEIFIIKPSSGSVPMVPGEPTDRYCFDGMAWDNSTADQLIHKNGVDTIPRFKNLNDRQVHYAATQKERKTINELRKMNLKGKAKEVKDAS